MKNHHFLPNFEKSSFWQKFEKNINFGCKLKNHQFLQNLKNHPFLLKFENSSFYQDFIVKFEKLAVSFQCCQHYNTEKTLVSLVS